VLAFFVTHPDRNVINPFLDTWGTRIRDRVRLVFYEDLPLVDTLPAADTYVFANVEDLAPVPLRRACEIADLLAHADAAPRVLNHPRGVLRRYDLLEALHERGVNSFRGHRVQLGRAPVRFPVFLRLEHAHTGAITPLLWTQQDVDRAIADAARKGYDIDSLLMVEFEDTSDEHGVFRKYVMYVIGEAVFPGNMAFDTNWVVKFGRLVTDERRVAEQRAAASSDAHEHVFRELAELAGVAYGRFDYALLDGRICVWELNTNPTLMLPADQYPPDIRPSRQGLADRLTSAIERLTGDSDRDGPPVRIAPRRRRLLTPARPLLRRRWYLAKPRDGIVRRALRDTYAARRRAPFGSALLTRIRSLFPSGDDRVRQG
jgi:hypothetical protein